MFISGVRDFSIHEAKKTPSPLFEMLTVVAEVSRYSDRSITGYLGIVISY